MARIYINAFNLSQHTCNCSKARDEGKCGALGSQDQVRGQRPKGCWLKHHRGHFGNRWYIRRDVQITLRRISECLEVVFIPYLDYYPIINYRSIQNSSKVISLQTNNFVLSQFIPVDANFQQYSRLYIDMYTFKDQYVSNIGLGSLKI